MVNFVSRNAELKMGRGKNQEVIIFIRETIIAVLMYAVEPISRKRIVAIIRYLEISDLSPDSNIFNRILEEEVMTFYCYADGLSDIYVTEFIFNTNKCILIPKYGNFGQLFSSVNQKIWNHLKATISRKPHPLLALDSFDLSKTYSKEMIGRLSEVEREQFIIDGITGENLNVQVAAVMAGFENPTPDVIEVIGDLISKDHPEIYWVFYKTMRDIPKRFITMAVDGATSDDPTFQKYSAHLLNCVVDGYQTKNDLGLIEILKGFWTKELAAAKLLKFNESDATNAIVASIKGKKTEGLKGVFKILDVRIQRPAFKILEDGWTVADLPNLENIDCSYDPLAPEEYRLKELVRLKWSDSAELTESLLKHSRQGVRDEAVRSLGKLGDLPKLKEIWKDTRQKITENRLNEVRFNLDVIAKAMKFCQKVESDKS